MRRAPYRGSVRLGPASSIVLALLSLACDPEVLDTTRRTAPRGTLGEELFRLFHRDLVHEADTREAAGEDRRAEGLMLSREGFVAAIDHVFPAEELADTQELLVKLLVLHDDGTIPGATRMLAEVADRLTEDSGAITSLAALGQRAGYVDLSHEKALVRRITRYPEYSRLAKALLRLSLEHDGLDAGGDPDPAESDALLRLTRLLSDRLAALELSEDAERSIVLAADLLLREDLRLEPESASTAGERAEIVARDPRGMARVRTLDGALVAPFADSSPRDGLPDVDRAGRFISANGTPLDLSPFGAGTAPGVQRDTNGRLVSSGGDLVFDYVAIDRTILAGLLGDTRALIRDGVPMQAIRTLDTVLGERLPDGRYGSENSGLLDLVHAIGAAGDLNELPEVLNLLRVLLEQHEATAMWLMLETEAQLDIADRYDVNLRGGSAFFPDLMRTVRKILHEPALAEALLVALQDPAIRGLPAATVRLLRHQKERVTAEDVAADRVFVTEVDRSLPDRAGNQSLQQRLLHLIYDTKGVRYQPELIGIPLGFIFEIDDLAEFYLLSIIGESEIPALVGTLTGLSARPSPEELAAFINSDQAFGNPQGREGVDVKDNDGDTLFAATASGMTDALRPLIRAFYDRGHMDLLFELFEVLHLHWATAESDYQERSSSEPRYSHLSGLRGYEPLLIDTFEHTRVIDAVQRLLTETQAVRSPRGRPAHDTLLLATRKLIAVDTTLRARDGRREVFFDGERVTPLSPFDLIRFSRARLRAAIRTRAQAQADWDAVVDALHRTFLEAERTGPERGRLASTRALPIAGALLSFLEERAAKHLAARDLSVWIREEVPREVEEALTSPELPALFDLVYAIDGDPELSAALGGLRDELFDEERGFPDLLVTTGDLLATAKDASIAVPFLRFLGRELAPERKLLFTLASLADKTLAVDDDEQLLELVRRALEEAPSRCAPLRCVELYADGVSTAIRQVHRTNPLDPARSDPNDLLRVTGAVGRYLVDGEHGVEKFYDMVAKRKLEAWQ